MPGGGTIDAGKILAGPVAQYHTGTAPGDGTLESITLATGAPSAGTFMGASEGDINLIVGQEIYRCFVDQRYAPIMALPSGQFMEASGMLKQIEADTMDVLSNGVNQVVAETEGDTLYVGNVGLAVPEVTGAGYCVTAPRRVAGHFFVFYIYRAFFPDSLSLAIAGLQNLSTYGIPFTVACLSHLSYTTTADIGYVTPDHDANP